MGKSQETYSKKEREKKKQKKAKEKLEKREMRKQQKLEEGKKTFEQQIMYVDEYGQFVEEKPDPTKRAKVKISDIVLGANKGKSKYEDIRKGYIKFFNDEKGYGFIVDRQTNETVFLHINNLPGPVKERDQVSFQVEVGPKGLIAVNVKLTQGH